MDGRPRNPTEESWCTSLFEILQIPLISGETLLVAGGKSSALLSSSMALDGTVGASPEPSKTGRGAGGRAAHGMLSCPAGSSHALQDTLLAVAGVAIWMDTNLDFRMATG